MVGVVVSVGVGVDVGVGVGVFDCVGSGVVKTTSDVTKIVVPVKLKLELPSKVR